MRLLAASMACGALLIAAMGYAQEATNTPPAEAAVDDALDASEADGAEPRRQLKSWNEYEGPYFTMRLGGGFLYDYASYAQDEDSKEQLTLHPAGVLRDFRFLLKGRIKV